MAVMCLVDAHTHNPPATSDSSLSVRNLIVGGQPFGQDSFSPSDVPNCSVGIHPWYIENAETQLAQLHEWATHSNVRAIGECGLDRLRGPSLAVQQAVFEQQIALSEAIRKPIIIHCVKAFAQILVVYKRLKPTQPWILHGVNNRLSVVKPLLDAGLYGSFGAALLRPASSAHQVLTTVDPDRILLETDGQPVSIQAIYEAAANRLNWPMEHLVRQVWDNAQRVFGL